MPSPPLRVCLDARVPGGITGGIQHVVEGLAAGLSALDGEDEYVFLGLRGTEEWLGKYLGGRCRLEIAHSSPRYRLRRSLEKRLARLRGAVDLPALAPEPAAVARAGAEVVHFPMQTGFRTARPSIYHPHDLQHRHLPEFFTPAERQVRDALFGAMSRQASLVAVASQWVRDDVAAQLAVPRERIVVVNWPPATAARRDPDPAELAETARRLALPPRYVFYPAQTWPHKNHAALLEALGRLRREGLAVPLVSSGRRTEHGEKLEARARELGIGDQVRFLGFVDDASLAALYAGAAAVVIPSLFEAASFPMWEAFRAGVPVACSNVTSLPAQAGGAALVFDPHDVGAIADAVRRLVTDEALRRDLVSRAAARVALFTWPRTARTFRALYRRLANRPLDPDDRALLAAAPAL
jgi:glycosyltransferase involved in cell wall biosynthesis